MKAKYLILVLGMNSLFFHSLAGDKNNSEESDSSMKNIRIVGQPYGKGLEFRHERVGGFDITSTSFKNSIPDGRAHVDNIKRWEVKLKFPVINHPSLKVVLGGSYFKEEYNFERKEDLGNPFYSSLQDKPLQTTGANLYVVKSFSSDKFFIFRGTARLNGDFSKLNMPRRDFLKYSLTPMIAVKESPDLIWGIGASYNDVFGDQAVYPVVMYNQTFNKNWGIETTLPVLIKLRYTANESNIFYGFSEIQGNKYNIRLANPAFSDHRSVYLQQSEARFMLAYERKLGGWFWLGLEGGARKNISFRITKANPEIDELILDNDLSESVVLNAHLFVRPPERKIKEIEKAK